MVSEELTSSSVDPLFDGGRDVGETSEIGYEEPPTLASNPVCKEILLCTLKKKGGKSR
jgi:hypothetical protein